MHDDSLLVVSGPTENLLYRAGRLCAGYSGHYHVSTIYQIERELRRHRMTETARKVLFPLLSVFRVSSWKRSSP